MANPYCAQASKGAPFSTGRSHQLSTVSQSAFQVLSFNSLSPWLVTYAIGLFAALFAAPFLIHTRIGGELEADARWERALLWWGVVAAAVLGASLLCGLPSGFDSGSLGGAIAIVGICEALLVLATLVFWLLSGG